MFNSYGHWQRMLSIITSFNSFFYLILNSFYVLFLYLIYTSTDILLVPSFLIIIIISGMTGVQEIPWKACTFGTISHQCILLFIKVIGKIEAHALLSFFLIKN